MTDEKRIAALREEILGAGASVRGVRTTILLVVLSMLAVVYLLPLGWPSVLAMVLAPFVYVAAACVVALPVAFLHRSLRRRQLRRALLSLDNERRAAVLLPLRTARLGDTRKLAAALLRDFSVRTEVAPAAIAEGRGDEASPAETAT